MFGGIPKTEINDFQRYWDVIASDIEMLQSEGFEVITQVDPNMVIKKKNKENDDDDITEVQIDFLIVKGKRIVPIEVKSPDYKNHKSFDYFKEKYQLKMNERYIIYTKDMEWKDDILFMPIYMTMCL